MPILQMSKGEVNHFFTAEGPRVRLGVPGTSALNHYPALPPCHQLAWLHWHGKAKRRKHIGQVFELQICHH